MSYFEMISPSLLRHIPELLAWLCGIVFAVLMVRRDSGKAEKLFLAGCSLMFVIQIARPVLSELVQSLISKQGMSNIVIARTMGLAINLPFSILAIAGLVCLVYAFWLRFMVRKREPA